MLREIDSVDNTWSNFHDLQGTFKYSGNTSKEFTEVHNLVLNFKSA